MFCFCVCLTDLSRSRIVEFRSHFVGLDIDGDGKGANILRRRIKSDYFVY